MAVPAHARVAARPFDRALAGEVRARLSALPPVASAPVAWLAGCLGDPAPELRARRVPVDAEGAGPLTVPETALHVDRGREAAARAAGDGIGLLVVSAPWSPAAARVDGWLCAGAASPGPLGALRRLGDAGLAQAAGIALGAGEQGLACACCGPAAMVAGALALVVEPGLRPRLLLAEQERGPVLAVLREAVAAALRHDAALR